MECTFIVNVYCHRQNCLHQFKMCYIGINIYVDDNKCLQGMYIQIHYIIIDIDKLIDAIHNLQYYHRQLCPWQ